MKDYQPCAGAHNRVWDVNSAYKALPVGNANFMWVQHRIHRLAPTGLTGFDFANSGAMLTITWC